MNQNEDWNATKAFEEMEALDAQDSAQKPQGPGKRRKVSVVTIAVSAVAVVAVVLCGVMAFNSMGVGKQASAVSEKELAEALTTETEQEEMTVVGLNGSLTVTAGGASTSSEESEDLTEEAEEEAEEGETLDAADADYIIPDSNSRYLTDADLSGLSARDLRLARNEIYARHGYIFSDSELKAYFESKSWYVGTTAASDFDDNVLSEIEKANISRIQSFE